MEIKNYFDRLKKIELFEGLSRESLSELFQNNQYRLSSYRKNSIIHFEGEKCMFLDILLKGEISIQKIDEKGNVLIITEFKAGDNLGGNLLFSHYPYYPMSVLAKSNAEILHIHKDLVLQLCQNSQTFLIRFLRCISEKTTILTNKIKAVTMKSIRESLVEFLNDEYHIQKNKKVHLSMTKKELAERLGIQRTSLSRELSKMKKDGLITYDAHAITICDPRIIKKL